MKDMCILFALGEDSKLGKDVTPQLLVWNAGTTFTYQTAPQQGAVFLQTRKGLCNYRKRGSVEWVEK